MQSLLEKWRRIAFPVGRAKSRRLVHGLGVGLAGIDLRRGDLSDDEVIAAIKAVPTHFTALSITAASVAYVSGPQEQIGIAAESMSAGMPIYVDPTVNQWRKCDASVSGKQTPQAMCMDASVSAGAPFKYAVSGTTINIGATVVKNTPYFLETAGAIGPQSDITTGWTTVLVCIASSTSNVILMFNNTGITN